MVVKENSVVLMESLVRFVAKRSDDFSKVCMLRHQQNQLFFNAFMSIQQMQDDLNPLNAWNFYAAPYEKSEYVFDGDQVLVQESDKIEAIALPRSRKFLNQESLTEIIRKASVFAQTLREKYVREKISSQLNTEELKEECKEENIDMPPELAIENAKEILRKFYTRFMDYDLHTYVTEDSNVAITSSPLKGKSLLIHCEPNGRIAMYFTFDRQNSCVDCASIEQLFEEHLFFFKKCITRINDAFSYERDEK